MIRRASHVTRGLAAASAIAGSLLAGPPLPVVAAMVAVSLLLAALPPLLAGQRQRGWPAWPPGSAIPAYL
jgi:hypothetical protein